MAAYTWPQVLGPLLRREDLEASATAWAMEQILSGAATPAQLAGFVIALRSKGETVTEVEGLVATMRDFATRITVPGRTLDVVGTGGDQAHTVNISTMSVDCTPICGPKLPPVRLMKMGLLQLPSSLRTTNTPEPRRPPNIKLTLMTFGTTATA